MASETAKRGWSWPERDPEPDPEPDCDLCEDRHEVAGWDRPMISCPFCTLVMLPDSADGQS